MLIEQRAVPNLASISVTNRPQVQMYTTASCPYCIQAERLLTRKGVAVTLIDADPDWRVYGAGITITGMSLRAFDDLSVMEEIRSRGFVHDGMRPLRFTGEGLGQPMRAPPGSPPVMLGGGILRPVLHDI